MFHQRPNHLGVEVGTSRRNGEIDLSVNVDGRDALALRRSGAEDIPVHPGSLSAGRNSLPEARKGDSLVRLVSQEQMKSAQDAFAGEKKKFPVDMQLTLKVGENAVLEISDGEHRISHTGEPVQAAQSRPADPRRIRAQMEKLGDTPFEIRNYSAEIDTNAFMPVSALNALRREAVEQLFILRMGVPHGCAPLELPAIERAARTTPELIAQSGSPEVLRQALEAGADRAAYLPEDLRRPALDGALNALPEAFDLVLPPVMAEETMNTLNAWAGDNAARIRRTLISNVGQFALSWPGETAGDMQLNIANELSISQLKDWNVELYTPSIELNCSQVKALGGRRQLVVYGALPLMHLRHCPLRSTKNLKGQHKSCRRCDSCAPEEKITAKALTDRTGAAFPFRRFASDEGCVLQLLNGAKLMLLRKAASLPACEGWRMLLDAGDPIREVVLLHRAAIDGNDPRSHEAWQAIESMNTTTGHYFRGAE